jgi:hypothetical protein
MVKVKSCPHCNDALYRVWDPPQADYFWSCLNCGRDFNQLSLG